MYAASPGCRSNTRARARGILRPDQKIAFVPGMETVARFFARGDDVAVVPNVETLVTAHLHDEVVFLVEVERRHRVRRRHENPSAPIAHAGIDRIDMDLELVEHFVDELAVGRIGLHVEQRHPGLRVADLLQRLGCGLAIGVQARRGINGVPASAPLECVRTRPSVSRRLPSSISWSGCISGVPSGDVSAPETPRIESGPVDVDEPADVRIHDCPFPIRAPVLIVSVAKASGTRP